MELFDLPATRHAGASPWQRYKKRKGGQWDVRIGYLTMTIPDDAFIRFSQWAEMDPLWRDKLVEAINGLCGS